MSLNLLFWAYTLIWILLAGYLGLLGLRQQALTRRVDRLRARLGSQTAGKQEPS
ncbi:MAG: CcmD family protein [Acidobacteria bacterium]|nr:CcmD family protein [Acidobacteriota bacterium]